MRLEHICCLILCIVFCTFSFRVCLSMCLLLVPCYLSVGLLLVPFLSVCVSTSDPLSICICVYSRYPVYNSVCLLLVPCLSVCVSTPDPLSICICVYSWSPVYLCVYVYSWSSVYLSVFLVPCLFLNRFVLFTPETCISVLSGVYIFNYVNFRTYLTIT